MQKPFLANGANLAYEKSFFKELSGFEVNNNIASGDDIFLLQNAVSKSPNDVSYLKCEKAIVTTQSEPSRQHYFSQRVRWASKSKYYNSTIAKLTGFLVFAMNLLMLTLLVFFLFQIISVKTFLYVALIKFSIDFYLIYKSASFFDQKAYLISYPISFFLYPFTSVLVVIMSIFGSYSWKGRTFNN